MGMLGMGSGTVFQMAPQRFLSEIELVTGIVGAAGGLGGFFLPSLMGLLKDLSGSYAVDLLLFATLVLGAAAILLEFGVKWSRTWPSSAIQRTGVFAYRGKPVARAQSGIVDAATD
jgi:NNP family nitrate/nitrite transporter-like MFS transporter